MKRRALLAATMAAALGQGVQALGEPIELALPVGESLPSRLGMSHVHTVRAVTDRLRGVTQYHGGQADLFGATATLYTRWMRVPATEAVKTRLVAALAELHTEAGWSCYDSGLDGAGYFTCALWLADEARDAYGIANAAWHAGLALVRSGHPEVGILTTRSSCSSSAVPPPWVPARQVHTGNSTRRRPPATDPHRAVELAFRDRLRRHGRLR